MYSKIKHIFDWIPKRALVFRNITDKEPVVRAFTFKAALKEAEEMGIKEPILMREPIASALHIH